MHAVMRQVVALSSSGFLLFNSARGNPIDGVVTSGTASITSAGSLLTIQQTSSRAIINWGSFNIANGETTHFQFNGAAGANSAVLNKVAAGNPSTIAGLLQSTVGAGGPVGGTVMVYNPDGILFTPTAQINVGSLTATTLGLADDNEFLNNSTLHFSSGSAGPGIRNQALAGNFNALGDVFLIASTVQNEGVISAGNTVGLAAGTTVTLAQSGAERLTVVAGIKPAGAAVDGVVNSGAIEAVSTELKAAGGNIYALAINNGGAIRATKLVSDHGRISLRAEDTSTQSKGAVSSTGSLGIGAAGSTADVSIDGSAITLGGSVDAGAGSLDVSGGPITLASDLTLNGASLTLPEVQGDGKNLVLNNSAEATLNGVIAGVRQFTASGSGTLTLNRSVSATSVNVSEATTFSGGTITTSGGQTYGGPLTLTANTVLTDSQGADIVFNDTINGAVDLQVNTRGNEIFNGLVGNLEPLASLTTDAVAANVGGSAILNQFGSAAVPSVATAGAQVYNDGLDLGADTVLAASSITTRNLSQHDRGYTGVTPGDQIFTGAVILTGDLTLQSSGGKIEFQSTVDSDSSPRKLSLLGSGDKIFRDAVGHTSPLASLATGAGGAANGRTLLNGGEVTTTAGQTYGATILGATTTLNSSADNITFLETLDGLRSLTINTGGGTRFAGAVGSGTRLASLTTDGAGTTTIGADIRAEAIHLGDRVILNGTGNQTLDAGNGAFVADNSITKITTGNLTLSGSAGVTATGNLAVNAGSLTVLNNLSAQGDVTASQNVNLSDATIQGALTAAAGSVSAANLTAGSVTAGQSVDVNSLNAGPVTVGTSLNVANAATVNGDLTAGTSVNVNGAGTFGGNITAGNGIRVNGLTTLNGAGDQTINSGAGVLTLNNWTLKTTPGSLLVNAPAGVGMDGVGDQGIISQSGQLTLLNSIRKTTHGNLVLSGGDSGVILGGSGSQQISLLDELQLTSDLTKTTPGDLTLEAQTGIVANGDLKVSSGSLIVQNKLTTEGDVVAAEDQLLNGSVTLNGADQTLTATSGQLAVGGNITKSTPGDLTLKAGNGVTVQGDLDAGGGKLSLDSAQAKVVNGDISDVASLSSTGGGDLTVGKLEDNTALLVDGHLHFESRNFQVNSANQVATAPTDVFTWPAGTVLFDSTTAEFYLAPLGTFNLTEDLFRRLLQVALPEVKKGRAQREVAGTAGNAGALGYVRRSGDPDLQVQAVR